MSKLAELLSLSDCAFVFNLDQYKESLQVYFRQDWTVDKFFAVRKGSCLCIHDLRFLIILSDGLDYGKINRMSDPRLILSFRKREADDIGFVLVTVDKKGW